MAKNRAAEKAAEEILYSVAPEAEKKKTPFLENRPLALVLAACAIVLGTLFGTHRSVAQQAKKVEQQYASGVLYEGYSIAGDLADRMEYAQNLTKIAQRYDCADAADAVTQAIHALDAAKGAGGQYDANFELTGAVEALNGALLSAGLSEQDERYRSEYYRNFTSCNDTISREAAAYNALVDSFNSEILGAFPTGTLAKLTGVRELEAFE